MNVVDSVSAQRGPDEALQAVALMLQGEVVGLDADLAVTAAGVLWTQDADFEGMPGVEYRSVRG